MTDGTLSDVLYAQLTRQPVPGRVKTRLLPALSAADAAALHQAMTLHCCQVLCRHAGLPGAAAGAAVQLWVDGGGVAGVDDSDAENSNGVGGRGNSGVENNNGVGGGAGIEGGDDGSAENGGGVEGEGGAGEGESGVAGVDDSDAENSNGVGGEGGPFAPCAALGATLHRQVAGDLGRRMAHIVEVGLRQHAAVILVGSDCPFIDAPYLDAALAALARHDAVLGPALDGGYVLFGLRRFAPVLFEGIGWGAATVLGDTQEALARLGWTHSLLKPLRDIDRPDDLPFLPESLASTHARVV